MIGWLVYGLTGLYILHRQSCEILLPYLTGVANHKDGNAS